MWCFSGTVATGEQSSAVKELAKNAAHHKLRRHEIRHEVELIKKVENFISIGTHIQAKELLMALGATDVDG